MNEIKHKTVIIYWQYNYQETTLKMTDVTITEALERAKQMGWKEPKWYKPWSYFNSPEIYTYNLYMEQK